MDKIEDELPIGKLPNGKYETFNEKKTCTNPNWERQCTTVPKLGASGDHNLDCPCPPRFCLKCAEKLASTDAKQSAATSLLSWANFIRALPILFVVIVLIKPQLKYLFNYLIFKPVAREVSFFDRLALSVYDIFNEITNYVRDGND